MHTPGPWYEDEGDVYKDIGDLAHRIARTDDWSEETVYNARLIAAAPDLLEALRASLVGGKDLTMDKWVKMARAALAKAGHA